MNTPTADPTSSCLVQHVADALVDAAHRATWPDGSLQVELDDTVIRTQLVPHLLAALRLARADDRRECLS